MTQAKTSRSCSMTRRRVLLEQDYYELFNKPNVHLVDANETPIEQITEGGIRTTVDEIELGVIIYATGFRAVTGSYDRIDYEGTNGIHLKDRWEDNLKTYLGIAVPDFPNMFNVLGPHQGFGNIPWCIEYVVQWVADCIEFCLRQDFTYVSATTRGENTWMEHVYELSEKALSTRLDLISPHSNMDKAHELKMAIIKYSGGLVEYRKYCDKEAMDG